ncbi:MAG: 23S rRNA (pseudouridine(1915)-N(3))-methyltransferase RlmH [Pseudomonadota bacterium]
MRVHICAVGRLRGGHEADLVTDYTVRFNRTGRGLGLGPLKSVEVEDRKNGGKTAEAQLLRKAMPSGATLCCLDERGTSETSVNFAARLARWRDNGTSDLTFIIGGADGLAHDLRDEADHLLSFGKMVWPHMLVRVMLTEQLYRAASILAGSPYHRA